MAIDLSTESVLSLNAAAKSLPGRPHVSTLWRWYARGVRGVRLETTVIGGRRFTSREALQRFAERGTAVASDDVLPARTDRQREAAIRRAQRELDAAGIGDGS